MNQLHPEQFEDLTNALISAFPDPDQFTMMVDFKLGINLSRIVAPEKAYDFRVYKLVQWADAQYKINELLAGGLNMNQRNQALRNLAKQFQLDEGAGDFESIVLPKVPIEDVEAWRTQMLASERPVCRVEIPIEPGKDINSVGVGTGFLIGDNIVITCSHVIDAIRQVIDPKDIVLRFDYKMRADKTTVQQGVTYKLVSNEPILDESKSGELDYALLQVDGTPAKGTVASQPLAPKRGRLKPIKYGFKKDDPLFIIQHPKATPLKFSPGAVINASPSPNRVAYTNNTEFGSSGSPCFTADWRVVALHHHGSTNGNQGVVFSAILNAVLPKQIPGVMPGGE